MAKRKIQKDKQRSIKHVLNCTVPCTYNIHLRFTFRQSKPLTILTNLFGPLIFLIKIFQLLVFRINTKYDYWADRIERNYNTTLLSQEEFEETKGVIRIVYRRRTDKTVISHE
jgi:hypothetical protein